MSLYLTVYPADDPNGTSLGTVDAATELRYMHVADGLGSGKVKINRHHSQAALLTQGRYCRVHSDVGVVGAFWLENGPVDLSSFDEEGGEFIEWSGRGSIAILERGRLLEEKYAPAPPASTLRGSFDLPGIWRWDSAGGTDPEWYGGILARSVEEGQNQPGTPLADVTVDFTRHMDSSGDDWDEVADEYTTPIGTDVLSLLRQFTGMDIIGQMDADLTFYAWNRDNFGTDRTGSFGTSTVRFEKGVNVADAIQRTFHDWVRVKWLLVEYGDNQYVTVEDATYPYATGPWGFISHTETDDVATATRMGQANIASRKRRSDIFSFPLMDHGTDPANGLYEPGPPGTTGHFWVGDSVTMHTGTGTYDVNAVGYPVSAITWVLLENGDYDVIVEIGQGHHWTEGSGESPGLCCGPELHPPTVPGTEASSVFGTILTWSEPQNVTVNAYEQTIPEVTIDGAVQAEHVIGNGYNHAEPNWRNHPSAGTGVPGSTKYFPASAGVPIALSMDVREQASPGTNASVRVDWFDSTLSSAFQSDTVYAEQPLSGWVSISETLTPPTGAVAWRLMGLGRWDNIAASTGSGTSTDHPYAGTSPDAAREDHTHPADEHDHDLDYAHTVHDHEPTHNFAATAAPTVNDDTDDGYGIGSLWVDTTNDNAYIAVDVTSGAAVWEQIDGGGGGASDLDDLTDVDTTTTPPGSGDVLAYDSGSSLWVPSSPSAPGAHASTHEDGGADEIEIASLPTSEIDTAKVLHPDGSGGVAWGTDATGGGGGGSWAGPDPSTATAVTPTGTAAWQINDDELSVLFAGQTANDAACLLIPIGAVTQVSVACRWLSGGNYAIHGIIFADGTTDAANAIWQQLTAPVTTSNIHFRAGTITNMATNLGITHLSNSFARYYMRMTLVSANTWRAEWSADGIRWMTYGVADQSRTITPTHIGLGVSSFGGSSNDRQVIFDDWGAS